ncbi:MAG TPA: DMT family transporter [Dongiaceae bacterium]|nr:DMT family transporter [Dongiaceae bacterium]
MSGIDRAGVAMTFWSAVVWSTGGFFVRLIPVDLWTMLGWRSLFGLLSILAFAIWQKGPRNLAFAKLLNWPGLMVVLCSGVGMICFVASTKLTSVANVAVLYATLPFMTAGLAWLWLRERPSLRTTVASTAALAGVAIMAWGSIHGGHLVGDGIAIAMTVLTAGLAVTVRRHRDTPILEAVIVGCALAMVSGFMLGDPGSATPVDLAWLALFGALTMGFGMAMFTVGARRIPSAQAALLGALETPLAPLWVWIAFNEVPSLATFGGGGLILAALIWHFANELGA